MRFYTRERYEAMQPGTPGSERIGMQQWKSAGMAYRRHLDALRPELPEGARALAETTLHDAIVEKAEWLTPDTLRLELDGSDCPWGPVGRFELTFSGVCESEGVEESVGQDWYYEEMDRHPEGATAFVYRVLLGDGELSVAADEVVLTVEPPAPAPFRFFTHLRDRGRWGTGVPYPSTRGAAVARRTNRFHWRNQRG